MPKKRRVPEKLVPLACDSILANMKRRFKKVDYEQELDLTVRLEDCLPPDHLARFVVNSVAQHGPRGGEPYAPEVLLGLLLYGYATGVFSTHKIERATYEAVPFRFIAGTCIPTTIRWPPFDAHSCPSSKTSSCRSSRSLRRWVC